MISKNIDRNQNKQIKQGVSWNAVNLVATKAISVLVRLFLARLIAPDYFGLISMVVVYLGLVQILLGCGLQTALIQMLRESSSSIRYSTAFWFVLSVGILWVFITWVIGIPAMVLVYGEPRLTGIAMVMSLSIIPNSLSIVPLARLTRTMKFKRIVISELSGMIGGAAIAISLAVLGAGVWSLVAQQLISSFLLTGMLWYFCKWRPRRAFSLKSLRGLFSYSLYTLGNQIVYYFRQNLDYLVIGIVLGATSLGVYALAYTLTETVRKSSSQIISRVMLPAYSKLQTTPEKIGPLYLSVTRAMSLLLFPISISLILHSERLIILLFGIRWADAAIPTQILAFTGLVQAYLGPSAEVLQGVGKAKLLFRISLVNLLAVAVPGIWIGSIVYGLPGAAAGVLLSFFTVRLSAFMAAREYIQVSLISLLRANSPALIGVLIAFASIFVSYLRVSPIGGISFILVVYAAIAFFVVNKK